MAGGSFRLASSIKGDVEENTPPTSEGKEEILPAIQPAETTRYEDLGDFDDGGAFEQIRFRPVRHLG